MKKIDLRTRQHEIPVACRWTVAGVAAIYEAGWRRRVSISRFSLLLLLTIWPAVLHAQWEYVATNGGVSITKYTGSNGAVVIPDTLGGLQVTSIGDRAFSKFWSNPIPTSVTIPGSVISIGSAAFQFCVNLTRVTFPTNSLTSIGSSAFSSCRSLRDITIPDTVTNLGRNAFSGCTSLTGVVIPGKVTGIGGRTFSSCRSLTSLTLGQSIATVDLSAFESCSSLRNINVDPNNSSFSDLDGVLFDKSQTTLVQWPPGRSGGYVVPNTVTTLGTSAFEFCLLTSITIPDSVTNIESEALSCTSLAKVNVPSSVSSIGKNAFTYCEHLSEVTLSNGVTSIGDGAFYGCLSLKIIRIPESVANMGIGPFVLCSSLASITVDTLNPSYSSLDGVLFNKSQTSLVQYPGGKGSGYLIPGGVIQIEDDAFRNCALAAVTIPEGVRGIGANAFASSGLLSVSIPSSMRSIGLGAFFNCGNLKGVTILPGLTSIGEGAFYYCLNLASVRIPDTVTELGTRAFAYGLKLTSVTLPGSVTAIGDYAFHGCGLTSITIPGSVTRIGENAFKECSSLARVNFFGNAPTLGLDAFASDTTTIYYLPGTTGWETTYGGRPTAPWRLPNPVILRTGPGFGIHGGQFGFRVSWVTNGILVAETATNLTNPTWIPLATNALSDGWTDFHDPQWVNNSAQFYRIRQW